MSPDGANFADGDRLRMRRALALARRGLGATSPNPMVGAVLVRDGVVLGEGWHRKAGEPHAEIEALRAAARAGNDAKGSTLYVTLEPCSTHGRTPPCVEAILAAGIREVVVAATDPNPAHSGRGLDLLRAGGVGVRSGLFAGRAEEMNAAFNHWITRRAPLVTAKWAMSLDGRIATRTGDSKWLTGPAARDDAMRFRHEVDAILAGVNTVLADNPKLNLRPVAGRRSLSRKRLRRIILDPAARTPPDALVLAEQDRFPTTVVVSEGADASALEPAAHIWRAPPGSEDGGIPLPWLLSRLGAEGVTHLLVEGGGTTHARFFAAGLVDRVRIYLAPLVIGGNEAPRAVGGAGFRPSLGEPPRLESPVLRRLGPDLLQTAQIIRNH